MADRHAAGAGAGSLFIAFRCVLIANSAVRYLFNRPKTKSINHQKLQMRSVTSSTLSNADITSTAANPASAQTSPSVTEAPSPAVSDDNREIPPFPQSRSSTAKLIAPRLTAKHPILGELMYLSSVPKNLREFAEANVEDLLILKDKLESIINGPWRDELAATLDKTRWEALESLIRHHQISPQVRTAIRIELNKTEEPPLSPESLQKFAEARAASLLILEEKLESLVNGPWKDELAAIFDQTPSEALELLVRHRQVSPETREAIRIELNNRGETARALAKSDSTYLDTLAQTQNGSLKELAQKELKRRQQVQDLLSQGEAIKYKEMAEIDPDITAWSPMLLQEIMKASSGFPIATRAAAAKALSYQRMHDSKLTRAREARDAQIFLKGLKTVAPSIAASSSEIMAYAYTNAEDLMFLAHKLSGEPDHMLPAILDEARSEDLEVLVHHKQISGEKLKKIQEELDSRKITAKALAEKDSQYLISLLFDRVTGSRKELAEKELKRRQELMY